MYKEIFCLKLFANKPIADTLAGMNSLLFGVDEAGRGCLAGPVCASVVALPEQHFLTGLTDSKQLSEKKREALFEPIQAEATAFGIGLASSREVDELNIYQATCLAVLRALQQALKMLPANTPIHFQSDGKLSLVNKGRSLLGTPNLQRELQALAPLFPVKEECIIKGDSKVTSIAAASVLAKVTRDRLMVELDKEFPEYAFAAHKGYGSKLHKEKLAQHGPCQQHRFSYAPVKEVAQNRRSPDRFGNLENQFPFREP